MASAPSAAVSTAPRRFLIAACDDGAQRIFVPAGRRLRERGHVVTHFAPFLRDRYFLRRAGESPLWPTWSDATADLPPELEAAVALRAKTGGISAVRDLRRFARVLLAAAHRYVPEFDAVVVWNGYELRAATVAYVARLHNLPVLVAENGLFPQTVQLDRDGANAASATARVIATQAATHDPLALADVAAGPDPSAPAWFRAGVTLLEWAEALWRPGWARFSLRCRWEEGRGRTEHAGALPGDAVELEPGYVFVPLQVHDDTQLLCHGEWVDSMATLLDAVAHAAGARPVMVREHPADVGRADYAVLRKQFPQFTWTRRRDLDASMRAAGAVVTVNSTVGLTALRLGRPVVVCGHAVYGVDGAVERALSPADVGRALDVALARTQAPALASCVLGHLYENQHVALDRWQPDDAGIARLAHRIEELACR